MGRVADCCAPTSAGHHDRRQQSCGPGRGPLRPMRSPAKDERMIDISYLTYIRVCITMQSSDRICQEEFHMAPSHPNPRKTNTKFAPKKHKPEVLDAAEAVFSEQGFEKHSLKRLRAAPAIPVAPSMRIMPAKKTVPCTDGAAGADQVHRHTPSFGGRGWNVTRAARDVSPLDGDADADHSWGTLMLEFKLYALRRPESREATCSTCMK